MASIITDAYISDNFRSILESRDGIIVSYEELVTYTHKIECRWYHALTWEACHATMVIDSYHMTGDFFPQWVSHRFSAFEREVERLIVCQPCIGRKIINHPYAYTCEHHRLQQRSETISSLMDIYNGGYHGSI